MIVFTSLKPFDLSCVAILKDSLSFNEYASKSQIPPAIPQPINGNPMCLPLNL